MSDGHPPYRRIKLELTRRIADREWRPGDLIPGEAALALEFGTARATVNRALRELAQSGLLKRRRKAGTRVASYPVRQARLAIPLVREEIEAEGARYGYRLLKRRIVAAPASVVERLGLRDRRKILHIACLHFASDKPFQYEDRWINPDAAPGATDESFAQISPNEWLVSNAPFSRAEVAFSAAAANEQEAEHLGVGIGSPVFIGERATWLGEDPVTLVRMIHPPSYRIVTRI